MKFTTLAYASVLALSACLSIVHSQPIGNTDLINANESTQVVEPLAFEKRYSNYHHSSNKKKHSKTTKYTTKHASKHFSKRTSKHHKKSSKHSSKKSRKHSSKKSSKHSTKKSSKHSTKKSKKSSSKKSSTKKSSKKSSTKKSSKVSTKSISSCYKKATFTQYWIPKEGDKDMLNNGKTVTLTGSKNTNLKSDSGSTIAKVSKTTYEVNIYF